MGRAQAAVFIIAAAHHTRRHGAKHARGRAHRHGLVRPEGLVVEGVVAPELSLDDARVQGARRHAVGAEAAVNLLRVEDVGGLARPVAAVLLIAPLAVQVA